MDTDPMLDMPVELSVILVGTVKLFDVQLGMFGESLVSELESRISLDRSLIPRVNGVHTIA